MKGDIYDIIDHLIDSVTVWDDKTGGLIQTPGARAFQGHLDHWSLQVFAYPHPVDPQGTFGYEGTAIGPHGVVRMTQANAKKAFAKASASQK